MKTVYNAIFEPHLCYSSLFWAQHSNSINVLFVLQKKKTTLRIKYFRNHCAHTSPLFRKSNILKLLNKITVENSLFINKYFNTFLLTIFKIWFNPSSNFHT